MLAISYVSTTAKLLKQEKKITQKYLNNPVNYSTMQYTVDRYQIGLAWKPYHHRKAERLLPVCRPQKRMPP